MFSTTKKMTVVGEMAMALSSPALRAAAARGMNEHIRMQERQAVRLMASQTKLSTGRVAGVTKSDFASPAAVMTASVVVTDGAIELGKETSRAWSRASSGATAGDWQSKVYERSFIVAKYGGAIFSRKPGSGKYPIRRLWGPVLPNELRRPTMPTLPGAIRLAGREFEKTVLKHLMTALG